MKEWAMKISNEGLGDEGLVIKIGDEGLGDEGLAMKIGYKDRR